MRAKAAVSMCVKQGLYKRKNSAERLRVGSLKHYLPLNYSSRALRDLCRLRMVIVQDCASLKIKLINLYRNQLSKNVRVADLLERCRPHMQPNYRFDPDILEEFKNPNIRLRVAFEISRIAMLEEMIEECNVEIQKQCKDQELVKLCKTIPGCGPVLSAVICTEIGTCSVLSLQAILCPTVDVLNEQTE